MSTELYQQALRDLEQAKREAAAFKWGYEYLQSRMESIGRHGWAHDCDGEIEARVSTPATSEGPSYADEFSGCGAPPLAAAPSSQERIPYELGRQVEVALECGALWTRGSEAHPRMVAALADFQAWRTGAAPAKAGATLGSPLSKTVPRPYSQGSLLRWGEALHAEGNSTGETLIAYASSWAADLNARPASAAPAAPSSGAKG